MDEKVLINSLEKIRNLFEKHKIEFWLDTGTLLGAIRNKKFIPWDYDIDLGTWHDNISKIVDISDDIRKLGFEICFFSFKEYIKILNEDCEIDINSYHLENDSATRSLFVNNKLGRALDYILWILLLENATVKRSKVPIILTETLTKIIYMIPNIFRKNINNIITLLYQKIGCKIVKIAVPYHHFENLSHINFYGMDFKVPKKTEEYLEYRYGKDWRIPKKDYVYYRDDGANIL